MSKAEQPEDQRLIEFMASELILLVRKECEHPDDLRLTEEEVLSTVKAWLGMRNLKREVYRAAKRQLRL